MNTKTFAQQIEYYIKTIAVNDAMRKAYVEMKHHQNLTSRIDAYFRKQWPNGGKDICFSFIRDFGQTHIKIWGGETGLSYDDGLFYCMNDSCLAENWNRYFEEEINRMDNTDSLENLNKEAEYYDDLKTIEKQIATLKTKAMALKPEGYIPPSATCRKAEHFWNEFSYHTQRNFPAIFKGE